MRPGVGDGPEQALALRVEGPGGLQKACASSSANETPGLRQSSARGRERSLS